MATATQTHAAASSEVRTYLPALLLLFSASGCSALIYEVVWYQLLQLAIGSTSVSLGILLATFTGTMGQFGLLVVPVLVILNLLSGSATPPESMPDWLINVMKVTPTPHFVSFSQAVLYRAAGLDIVWPQLAALVGITVAFFGVSLMRFRTTIASFG